MISNVVGVICPLDWNKVSYPITPAQEARRQNQGLGWILRTRTRRRQLRHSRDVATTAHVHCGGLACQKSAVVALPNVAPLPPVPTALSTYGPSSLDENLSFISRLDLGTYYLNLFF